VGDVSEQITGEHDVSRLCFGVPPGLAPESAFTFASSDRAESAVWRKYAPQPTDVHKRGCNAETEKNARRLLKGVRPVQYIGFKTANVGAIRDIKSERGHQFDLIHFPENGDLAHTHIVIKSAKKLKPSDVLELITLLLQRFSALKPYPESSQPR